MIIVRSPLRISLAGGGTDLPSYYRTFGGYVLAAAIDRYVYVSLHRRFVDKFLLRYSRMEEVATVEEIQHPIIRAAFQMQNITDSHCELTSVADIPAGTGLGSSSSFTAALLKALYAMKRQSISPGSLANEAAILEIELLHEPIGKQDQYIASYGGLREFTFRPDDSVQVNQLPVSEDTISSLEENLVLVYSGQTRAASDILQTQKQKSEDGDAAMLKNLHQVKEQANEIKALLCCGSESSFYTFAAIMNEHWARKKERSPAMTNGRLDTLYQAARYNGALGGKLVGAGGGGFFLFYTQNRTRFRQWLQDNKLQEVRFRFDFEGTKQVL